MSELSDMEWNKEAIRKIRNSAIEECARAADEAEWQVYGYRGRISSVIRDLKDKP